MVGIITLLLFSLLLPSLLCLCICTFHGYVVSIMYFITLSCSQAIIICYTFAYLNWVEFWYRSQIESLGYSRLEFTRLYWGKTEQTYLERQCVLINHSPFSFHHMLPGVTVTRSLGVNYVSGYTWTVTFDHDNLNGNKPEVTLGSSSITGIGSRVDIHTTTEGNQIGGSFTVTYNGQTTSSLAASISGWQLHSALEGLSTISTGIPTHKPHWLFWMFDSNEFVYYF